VRETVLHLVTRDEVRLREMEAALGGVRASWERYTDAEYAPINEALLAPLRHLGWEDAVRLLQQTRQRLLGALERVPDEPADVWREPHAFGWMFARFPEHDWHHARVIKRWRIARGG
jgi:hypothetical protein